MSQSIAQCDAGSPKTGAVVLAAGKGTRMHSNLPKVLHRLLDEPMLDYVLRALQPLFPEAAGHIWSVIGHGAEMVQKSFGQERCSFVLQQEQLGTGHALQTAWPQLKAAGLEYALVVNGDTPLIAADILKEFVDKTLRDGADLAVMTLTLPHPASFGRVLRQNGVVRGIIEAKDYDPAKHGAEPKEINAGIYCLRLAAIEPLLFSLSCDNKNKEYYITDLVAMASEGGLKVEAFNYGADQRLLGVNSPRELVESEEFLRAGIVDAWLDKGVLIYSPALMRVGPRVELEPGAVLCGPSEIYGQSFIGSGARIETHCYIRNAQIARDAQVRSYCHIEEASVGERCQVGPTSRLRPGAVLEEDAHIGNFVEMKKARLGKGAKANHLTYLGDAEVGAGANIGAGTITCNYDGKNKFKTVIGKNAFVGSNTALVAPVVVGDNALIGAGSVITHDVPENSMAIARGRQSNMPRKKKP